MTNLRLSSERLAAPAPAAGEAARRRSKAAITAKEAVAANPTNAVPLAPEPPKAAVPPKEDVPPNAVPPKEDVPPSAVHAPLDAEAPGACGFGGDVGSKMSKSSDL